MRIKPVTRPNKITSSWSCRIIEQLHFHRCDHIWIPVITILLHWCGIKMIKTGSYNNCSNFLINKFIFHAEVNCFQWSACFNAFVTVDACIHINVVYQRNRLAHWNISCFSWCQIHFKIIWNLNGADFCTIATTITAISSYIFSFFTQGYFEISNKTFNFFNFSKCSYINEGLTRRVNHFRCKNSYTTVHSGEGLI